jgi:peptide deformylase
VPSKPFQGKSPAGPYGDFVGEVDAAIGRIADAVAGTNTLLIVTSDNGAPWEERDAREAAGHRANATWRGQKSDIQEGGHRVPFLAHWPGRIAPNSISTQLVCLTDLYATVAELAGASLAADMAETMYAESGVGLAATQVGVQKRILVIDASPRQSGEKLRVFINPELVSAEGRTKYSEGCLSIPGETEEIERFERVTVRAMDEKGETFEVEATGLLAIALQHELDHLDGVLFADRLSWFKRLRLRRRLRPKC